MNFKTSLLFLLLAVLLTASCKDDPCDEVICLNEGVCVDGLCECPFGYEGEFCEALIREKFLGNFFVTSDCEGDPAETDSWMISASADGLDKILILGIHKLGSDISATITESNMISIEEQSISASPVCILSGSGSIDSEGQLTIEYTVVGEDASDITNCSVSATR